MKIQLAERVVSDPEIMDGKPTIEGTRVTVAKVVRLVATGRAMADICSDYPYLTQDDVKAALEFSASEVEHTSYRALPA